MDAHPAAAEGVKPARPKVNNACEACRAAKVRCQPSVQSGICRRCLEFKRECVFRTGPRTRRPRQSRLNLDGPRLPPPPGPSKTFSINFEMPAPEDVSLEALESLASRHESYIDTLLPPDDAPHTPMYDDLMMGALSYYHQPGGTVLTPPSSHPHSHQSPHSSSSHSHHGGSSSSPGATPPSLVSLSNIGMKPQFNLDSATKLLDIFREMLTHYPCIVLPVDATVPSLAKTRPFVLLAILSVASGAASLQGHSLYDDEFRKILGLKFVAGGERSVELLQGLLIYTAWYPFHLRPKNKQAFQYVRMAAEIANDLELVSPPDDEVITPDGPISSERLEGMRTYLACYYLVSAFLVTWSKLQVYGVEYNKWTETCCEVLERRYEVRGDQTLCWLVRCTYIIDQTGKIDHPAKADGDDEREARFKLKGVETQFREWKDKIPQHLLTNGSALHIATTFAELYIYASPLLRFGVPRSGSKGAARSPLVPLPDRIAACIPVLRSFLDVISVLPQSAFIPVTTVDWGKIIQFTILCLRISLPLPACPGWNDAAARESLQFGAFLERFSQASEGDEEESQPRPAGSSITVLSASKVVFAVVKHKYEGRLARMQASDMAVAAKGLRGCPMLDGSLESYFPSWDPAISTTSTMALDWYAQNLQTMAMVDGGSSGSSSLAGDMNMTEGDRSGFQAAWPAMNLGWPSDELIVDSAVQPNGLPKCPIDHSGAYGTHTSR
ncbi:hypothetical protein B0T11DRAFT_110346 [Plectosphaerella cucumerina]|uniref:Zn(2)-C6 fungal-type domain-containing protein n=1 Tax=Plectosphaerella cucumerina TaxID=40658 RepID=A0A8K0T9Y3_9PEZI|nr:hypothetical protein B0T11DRAFT_110346 [Plectosphaerella cucumerina]